MGLGVVGKKKSKTGNFCSCCKTADLRVLIAGRDEVTAKPPVCWGALEDAGGLVGGCETFE